MNSQNIFKKRVKERSIIEAKQKVELWRHLFVNGEIDQNGKKIKYSLQKAAEMVGVPRKSLEDYRFLFRKAQNLLDFKQIGDKRMGYLRLLLKQHEWQQKQQQQSHLESFNSQKSFKEKSKIMKIENFINAEDMIVEGENNYKYQDEELLYISDCENAEIIIKKQERNYDQNFVISKSDFDQKVCYQFETE